MFARRLVLPFCAVICVAVIGAFVSPRPLSAQGVATRNAKAAPRGEFSGRPFPVSLVDVAAEAGLSMQFVLGPDDHKDYILEANGMGVAFVDYDNDGWTDAFLVNGARRDQPSGEAAPTSRLYRNRQGKFEDVTGATGTGRAGWGGGVCAGDYDNDGFTDLYVSYWGPNALFRNRGGKGFEEVAEKAGVSGPRTEWSSGCTFLDYDRDGLLDLFVTSYQKFDFATAPKPGKTSNCEWKGLPVFCGPRGLPYGTVTLFHNAGGGRFEDVSDRAGVREVEGFYAFTPIAADLNQDGWVDLFVACDSTPSLFFRNNKDGTFTEIGVETALAFNEHGFEQGGMGVSAGDYDHDGLIDLVKTNFTGDYPNLYRNMGGAIFEDVVVRSGLAVNPQYVGWGIGFVDLDNDGWLDVLQVNGHVYPEIDKLGITEKYKNPRIVYRNLGNGRYEDVSDKAGPGIAALHSSRGAAFADFDNDGDADVLVMNMGETPSLLRNDQAAGNGWVQLLLEGTKSNRSAIGATVRVRAGDLKQAMPVVSQSSFLSQNDFRLHFGLGKAAAIEEVKVLWPSGREEVFTGVKPNGIYRLVEGKGAAQSITPGESG